MKKCMLAKMISLMVIGLPLITFAQSPTPNTKIVHIAELKIDPYQLDAYKKLLADEIRTSIQKEPGVISLQAVQLQRKPYKIRLLEIYDNQQAYKDHLNSSHFLKYKTESQAHHMVKSLKIIQTYPIALGSKAIDE